MSAGASRSSAVRMALTPASPARRWCRCAGPSRAASGSGAASRTASRPPGNPRRISPSRHLRNEVGGRVVLSDERVRLAVSHAHAPRRCSAPASCVKSCRSPGTGTGCRKCPCASSCRVGFPFVFRYPTRRHHEPRHAERALEPLLVHHACCTGCSVPSAAASPRSSRSSSPAPSASASSTNTAAHRPPARARAALRPVAPQLRPRQPSLYRKSSPGSPASSRPRPLLAVDVQRDEPFNASRTPRRRRLPAQRRRAEQVARRDTAAPAAMTPLMKFRLECWSRCLPSYWSPQGCKSLDIAGRRTCECPRYGEVGPNS